MADEDPKIIIDEDWKSQVQREKEEAVKEPPSEAAAEQPSEEPQGQEPEMTPFLSFLNGLVSQCLLALGAIAPPDAKQVTVNIEQARYLIDVLMTLREKTKGNLTKEEDDFMTEALSELQRGYVLRAQQVQEAAFRDAGVNPEELKQ